MRKIIVLATIIGVFVTILISSSWYTVDEGERAVLLTNGRISDIVGSGLHFKIPMFQTVSKISTRTITVPGTRLAMYSYDQQIADLQLSVTYHIAPEQVKDVYTRYGRDGIYTNGIQPRVNEVSKTVFGQFTASRAIQERAKLNQEMNIAIKRELQDVPAVIENIQIENVDFSDTYEAAVEQAARAKADIERAKSELARVEQEAQQKVKNAEAEAAAMKARVEAEAAATKARAEAEAYSTKVRGEAEAEVIRQRGQALKDNPAMIELIKAERWNGELPVTMVPGATVPFLNLSK